MWHLCRDALQQELTARELRWLLAPARPSAHREPTLGKTSVSLAPAPPAQAPAQPADVQREAEENQPDPAVGNRSPVSWAEGAEGTQQSQTRQGQQGKSGAGPQGKSGGPREQEVWAGRGQLWARD